MASFVYNTTDESGTAAFGAALAELLPDGTAVALRGTLGAGKTRLVQAIAEACGVDRHDVLSPTFVLAQEYHGQRTIYHIDVYRLRDVDEFDALGVEEYFESDGLVFVEWADRVESSLPRERIDIHIEITGGDSRWFEVASIGSRYASVVEQLRRRFEP